MNKKSATEMTATTMTGDVKVGEPPIVLSPSAPLAPHSAARPPAMLPPDAAAAPWLSGEGEPSSAALNCVKPAAHIPVAVEMPHGITKIKDGQDIFAAFTELKMMFSQDHGTSCSGRVIDDGRIGVIERQGRIAFVKSGQWTLWDPYTQWSNPSSHSVDAPIIRAKGITVVTLNQRQVVVAQDASGKSMLLGGGRYILVSPAALQGDIISLVDLPRHKHVNRFDFFNVPQGEVAGVTMATGQIKILLPGVHIIEDAKFERFLPTVPIQSKLKKEVVTSDLVSVSLEVDITTTLVDCARFLKMSAQAGAHADEKSAQSVGCKDLYDAIEESAISHFIDTFSKTQYYNFRTRQGEVESKFEETALQVLDQEAGKYGGRVTKVNILKQRADAVEAVYAAHTSKQLELEQKKQSQLRQYEIDESEQKHRQQMNERDEKGNLQRQTLTQERDIQAKQHGLRVSLQDAKAVQEKLDYEAKSIMDRQRLQATAESDAAKIRATGAAQEQAAKILIVAEANAKAEEMRGQAFAKSEDLKTIALAKGEELRGLAAAKAEKAKNDVRLESMRALATLMKENPSLVDLEKQRLHDDAGIAKVRAIVEAGGKVVPVELMKLMDITDERVLKRLENQSVLRVFNHDQQQQQQQQLGPYQQQKSLAHLFAAPPPRNGNGNNDFKVDS